MTLLQRLAVENQYNSKNLSAINETAKAILKNLKSDKAYGVSRAWIEDGKLCLQFKQKALDGSSMAALFSDFSRDFYAEFDWTIRQEHPELF